MKALKEYTEFISDNVQKFHNLIKDLPNDDASKTKLEDQVTLFSEELFKKAEESIDVDASILEPSQLETIVALFMQASELWHVFCKKYKETYPNDPPYFNEDAILKAFESAYKKGWLFKNEPTE